MIVAHVAKVSDRTRYKVSGHSNLKTLSPKQMLQRLPIALAQVKEIRQVIYSLYRVKKVPEKYTTI